MTERTFIERRAQAWEHLENLLHRAGRRGAGALAADEVEQLGRLYRSTTSDLAFAQGRAYPAALLAYLNRLTARAHAHVYGANAPTGRARIVQFYTRSFPREFRRSIAPIAICALLTIVAAIVAYAVVTAHPADAYALLPSELILPTIHHSLHDSNFKFDSGQSPLASSQIITNNIKVAIFAFAGCVTLGISTIYIVVFNGLMLGGVGAMFANAGFGFDFWATVAPHGVIELTAIQIAGAAGLLISAGIVAPGRLRRADAIRANAKRAGVLIAGVASMLVVAGTIEGFFSPLRLSPEIRIGAGALTALTLLLYFGFAGRSESATVDRVA